MMAKFYLRRGDVVIVKGKRYYQAQRPCVVDRVRAGKDLKLISKQEYLEWFESLPWMIKLVQKP